MKKLSVVIVAVLSMISSFAQSKEENFAASIAENLRMFQSVPMFKSWASRQVKDIDLTVRPDGDTGSTGYGWGRDYDSSVPSIEEMLEIVEDIDISFMLARPVEVNLSVYFRDTDGNPLFEGESYFWPQQYDDGWRIPSWVEPEMQIARRIAVKLPGVRHLKVVIRSKYGGLLREEWIGPDQDGYFHIPRQAIDNEGEFVGYSGDYSLNSVTVSIRSGQYLKWKSVEGFVKPTMQGVQILRNPVRLDIAPKARYEQGTDLLFEVTMTEKTLLRIKAQTTEGEYADVVHVVNMKSGDYREFIQEPGTDIIVPFTAGTYHIYALWDYFTDNTAQYDHHEMGYSGGGKGGGTAGGDGNW